MTTKAAYIGGMTWGWTGIRGTWTGEKADRSMELMAERLSVNWTAIALGALQDHAHSTEIKFREAPTVTDEEVLSAIHKAKELGLNVCLKPVVNCADGTWRAHINFFDLDVPCEPKWSDWFASYTTFILHYAKIAEETGCEMFCVGCEMVQTDRRETEWRELIAEVRKVYSGIVTYNCDKYQEGQIKWWDAVDVISSSGYYPIDAWEEQLNRIEKVVSEYDKPFSSWKQAVLAAKARSIFRTIGDLQARQAKRFSVSSTRRCSPIRTNVIGLAALCFGIGQRDYMKRPMRVLTTIIVCMASKQNKPFVNIMQPK